MMGRNVLSVTRSVFFIALFFTVLYFAANLPGRQSAVLAAILYVPCWMAFESGRQPRPFSPYWVSVAPNLHRIVTDFELAEDTEESWAELRVKITELADSPVNIWRSEAFTFSVITPDLTYQHGWNSFTTEVDCYASLQPIVQLRPGQKSKRDSPFGEFSPSLELDKTGAGYRITLTILDSHWDKIKDRPVLKTLDPHCISHDQMSGAVEIVIVTIPDEEFAVHFRIMPEEYGRKSKKLSSKMFNRRAAARARWGWTGQPETGRYETELPPDESNTVEHRYATVRHAAI